MICETRRVFRGTQTAKDDFQLSNFVGLCQDLGCRVVLNIIINLTIAQISKTDIICKKIREHFG